MIDRYNTIPYDTTQALDAILGGDYKPPMLSDNNRDAMILSECVIKGNIDIIKVLLNDYLRVLASM